MKRGARRPYKPPYKRRKPTGFFNRAISDPQNIENISQENFEIFVGYHKKNENIDENEEENVRLIEFSVDDGCPYFAWNLYFPLKSK